MSSKPSRAIAIIGAGVIGLSWARLARDHGWRVAITDPSPKLGEWVEAEFGSDDPLVTWSADQNSGHRLPGGTDLRWLLYRDHHTARRIAR
jgi:glycine/D-amino acid oxidase-like deaminating enzyme